MDRGGYHTPNNIVIPARRQPHPISSLVNFLKGVPALGGRDFGLSYSANHARAQGRPVLLLMGMAKPEKPSSDNGAGMAPVLVVVVIVGWLINIFSGLFDKVP